jgi:hypothetical protein
MVASSTMTTKSFEARGPPVKCLWERKTNTRRVAIVFRC